MSETDVNLSPFLSQTSDCYTNLIFYEPLDFVSPKWPIQVSTPRYDYFPNDTSCKKIDTVWDSTNEPGFNICPRIRSNFHLRNVLCLAVILVGADAEHRVKDAIWYIRKFWSGRKKGEFMTMNGNITLLDGRVMQPRLKRHDVPYFPSRIYIQILISPIWKKASNLNYPQQQISVKDAAFSFLPVRIVTFKNGTKISEEFVEEMLIKLCYFDNLDLILIPWASVYTIQELSKVGATYAVPVCVHHYDNILLQTFITFVSRAFNTSTLFSFSKYKLNPDDFRCRPLGFLFRGMSGRQNSGATVYFQYIQSTKFMTISSSALTSYVTFMDYLKPFQAWVWIALIVVLSLACLIFHTLLGTSRKSESAEMLILSSLVDQSFNMSTEFKKKIILRLMFGVLFIMGLVLSNAYRGVVITSLVKPLERSGIESLVEALRLKYTVYFEANSELYTKIYSYCCRQPTHLQTPAEKNTLKEEHLFFHDCADLVFMDSPLARLYMGSDNHRYYTYIQKMLSAGGRRQVAANASYNSNEDLTLQLISLTEPVPCDKVVDSTLLKQNVLYIGTKEKISLLMLKARLTDVESMDMYKVEDTTGAIVGEIFGYRLIGVQFIRDDAVRNANAFVESGTHLKIENEAKNSKELSRASKVRKMNGKLSDESKRPKPLNLKSKISMTFFVYVMCLSIAIFGYLWEILYFYHDLTKIRIKKRIMQNRSFTSSNDALDVIKNKESSSSQANVSEDITTTTTDAFIFADARSI